MADCEASPGAADPPGDYIKLASIFLSLGFNFWVAGQCHRKTGVASSPPRLGECGIAQGDLQSLHIVLQARQRLEDLAQPRSGNREMRRVRHGPGKLGAPRPRSGAHPDLACVGLYHPCSCAGPLQAARRGVTETPYIS
jgi:hypothetical protein